jgi:hypothetical protein
MKEKRFEMAKSGKILKILKMEKEKKRIQIRINFTALGVSKKMYHRKTKSIGIKFVVEEDWLG